MKNNYRIVFMGTPDFCLPALSAMVEHGYTPVAAYTQPDKINGRGKKINYSPVKTLRCLTTSRSTSRSPSKTLRRWRH